MSNYFYWKQSLGKWHPQLEFGNDCNDGESDAPIIRKEDKPRYSAIHITELIDLQECIKTWPKPETSNV